MIELMLAIALVGSLIAGLWDIFTTEIPDEIPTVMAASGIFGWFVFMLTDGNYLLFLNSIAVGTAYLLFGWIMYKLGQWGGGDAVIMAAIGYLIPSLPIVMFFPVAYFINVFFVGAVWVVIYAMVLGILKPRVLEVFFIDLKRTWKVSVGLPIAFLFIILLIISYLNILSFAHTLLLFIPIAFLVVFYRYARVVEKVAFRKRIPASCLKAGDVLLDSKLWIGLKEEEVEEIKKRRKIVTIKEGVRFGPTFFLSLVLTVLYGNVLFLFWV